MPIGLLQTVGALLLRNGARPSIQKLPAWQTTPTIHSSPRVVRTNNSTKARKTALGGDFGLIQHSLSRTVFPVPRALCGIPCLRNRGTPFAEPALWASTIHATTTTLKLEETCQPSENHGMSSLFIDRQYRTNTAYSFLTQLQRPRPIKKRNFKPNTMRRSVRHAKVNWRPH